MNRIALKVISKSRVLEDAKTMLGGLSQPSKMPWFSYSIPAKYCKTGSKLSELDGTVCSDCYACKGRYLFNNVQDAMQRRFDKLVDLKQWARDFAIVLNDLASSERDKSKLYFRWHDSGDIQSPEHLQAIIQIAWDCPTIRFWLPTRESQTVIEHSERFGCIIPPNLTIRLSAHMVDSQNPPKIQNLPTSTVCTSPEKMPDNSVLCEAYSREGKCLDCRACWDPNTQNVSYLKH